MKFNKLFSLTYNERLLPDKKDFVILRKGLLLKLFGFTKCIHLNWILDLLPCKYDFDDFYPQPLEKEPEVYLSIAAILKNEAPYIKEWIEFHKLVGVERFYLYDNESTDKVKEILAPYIEDGTVVYTYVKGTVKQMPVYQDAVYHYKYSTRWMAFLDLDEYLFPVEKESLPDLLKDYEQYPALVANWVMFDSNGLLEHPQGKLVTETYTRVYKNYNIYENHHVKSIVNPKKVRFLNNPHYCYYNYNQYAVTENVERCKGPITRYNSVNKIRINHYYCKSLQDYKLKIDRGRADILEKREFNAQEVNFQETTQDYAIQKYLPELRKRMNASEAANHRELTATNV